MRLTGIALLAVAFGSGSAGAAIYEFGGSTATIEQSGGGRNSSEVTRYRDGQKIITRDGNSKDITIQGGGGSSHYDHDDFDWEPSGPSGDPFDSESLDERFSRIFSDSGEDLGCPDCGRSKSREAFRQRMLDRMDSRFSW